MDYPILIKSCIAGDRKAHKKLYETFAPEMYLICIKYMKTHEDAEDCLQNGFIRLFTRLHTFKFEGVFEGWVRRTFVNICLDALVSKKYFYEDDKLRISTEDTGFNRLQRKEANKALHTIAKGHRNHIILYNLGYSHKEISEIMGCSEVTSRSQYMRGKIIFKKKLKEVL